MHRLFAVLSLGLFVVALTGCGSEEPQMVADPAAYEPYQASAEEVAEQAEMSRQAAQRKR